VVSQFTLFGSLKKGQRPSFERAAAPEFARMMVEMFVLALEKETHTRIEQGEFGADMQVQLINDGPVTLILDSFIKDL
jgi:D-tyrosyl-tRNA(Tyr) deacylase